MIRKINTNTLRSITDKIYEEFDLLLETSVEPRVYVSRRIMEDIKKEAGMSNKFEDSKVITYRHSESGFVDIDLTIYQVDGLKDNEFDISY